MTERVASIVLFTVLVINNLKLCSVWIFPGLADKKGNKYNLCSAKYKTVLPRKTTGFVVIKTYVYSQVTKPSSCCRVRVRGCKGENSATLNGATSKCQTLTHCSLVSFNHKHDHSFTLTMVFMCINLTKPKSCQII